MRSPSAQHTYSRTAREYGTRYEALRRHVLLRAGHPQARDGLAVLLREGIAAWLEAWSKVLVLPRSAMPVARPSPVLSDGVNQEVIRVLAGMALAHVQEVRP